MCRFEKSRSDTYIYIYYYYIVCSRGRIFVGSARHYTYIFPDWRLSLHYVVQAKWRKKNQKYRGMIPCQGHEGGILESTADIGGPGTGYEPTNDSSLDDRRRRWVNITKGRTRKIDDVATTLSSTAVHAHNTPPSSLTVQLPTLQNIRILPVQPPPHSAHQSHLIHKTFLFMHYVTRIFLENERKNSIPTIYIYVYYRGEQRNNNAFVYKNLDV